MMRGLIGASEVVAGYLANHFKYAFFTRALNCTLCAVRVKNVSDFHCLVYKSMTLNLFLVSDNLPVQLIN